jgi:hypothetical protein
MLRLAVLTFAPLPHEDKTDVNQNIAKDASSHADIFHFIFELISY